MKSTNPITLGIIILLAVIFFHTNVYANKSQVFQNKADSTMQVDAGSEFQIQIPSNPTTGFSWHLGGISDTNIVVFFQTVYNDPAAVIPGKGGTETWTFKAKISGTAVITLNYSREWEKDAAPAITETYTINVK